MRNIWHDIDEIQLRYIVWQNHRFNGRQWMLDGQHHFIIVYELLLTWTIELDDSSFNRSFSSTYDDELTPAFTLTFALCRESFKTGDDVTHVDTDEVEEIELDWDIFLAFTPLALGEMLATLLLGDGEAAAVKLASSTAFLFMPTFNWAIVLFLMFSLIRLNSSPNRLTEFLSWSKSSLSQRPAVAVSPVCKLVAKSPNVVKAKPAAVKISPTREAEELDGLVEDMLVW